MTHFPRQWPGNDPTSRVRRGAHARIGNPGRYSRPGLGSKILIPRSVHIPPGRYSVAAAVRYNGIDAVSERHAITVVPARCTAASFATDQLCLPTLYGLLKLEGEGDAGCRVFLEVRAASGAAGVLTRVALPPEVSGNAGISVADFASSRQRTRCSSPVGVGVGWKTLRVIRVPAGEIRCPSRSAVLRFRADRSTGSARRRWNQPGITEKSADSVLLHRVRLEADGACRNS
jgi:hypothetical protein